MISWAVLCAHIYRSYLIFVIFCTPTPFRGLEIVCQKIVSTCNKNYIATKQYSGVTNWNKCRNAKSAHNQSWTKSDKFQPKNPFRTIPAMYTLGVFFKQTTKHSLILFSWEAFLPIYIQLHNTERELGSLPHQQGYELQQINTISK